jgi:integrase
MKEKELSSIISQLNDLLLKCNTIICNNETMENVEEIYGFHLMEIKSSLYKSGFYYAVKYRDFETNKWLTTKTSTKTDDKGLATAFAIENREKIIKKYKEHRKQIHKKNDGKEFYKMLEEYYTENSKYLQDDYANNKRRITKRRRVEAVSIIKTYFIPYFKENNINSIKEITNSVYSKLKIYLQNVKNIKNRNLSTKTINNNLMFLNRILQYHYRNELIEKLPYSQGTGTLKISKDEKAKARKPAVLPVDKLKGIFNMMESDKNKRGNALLYYTLSLIGLTTGMRDSEIARIKGKDLIPVSIDGKKIYLLKAYNHKTDYYNVEETDSYRKIPLHPFVIEMLKRYIQNNKEGRKIGKEDYIFGTPKYNEDTNIDDGYLHQSKFHKAIVHLYKQIILKEKLRESLEKNTMDIDWGLDTKVIEKEMKEKNITFYSLRHTFNTLCVLFRYGETIARNDDIIDYFTGHKIQSEMRANYTHINKVDNRIFYENYGKYIIDMLNKFIFYSEKQNEIGEGHLKELIIKEFKKNKELINPLEPGEAIPDGMEKILLPVLEFIGRRNNDDIIDDDDIFSSV